MSIFPKKLTNEERNALKSSLVVPLVKKSSTFEVDVQFLIFSIKHQLKLAVLQIGVNELDNVFIKDTYIKDLISETSYNVLTKLSPDYKRLLLEYWTDEGLNDFITSKITMELTNIAIKLNTQRVNGYNENDTSNIKITRMNDILSEYN